MYHEGARDKKFRRGVNIDCINTREYGHQIALHQMQNAFLSKEW
jgi:hypothetical protein